MKTSLFVALLAGAVALSSCSTLKKITKRGEYHPEYLNQGSALDGPGVAAAREAQRKALEQEGSFAPGDTPEVQQGKVYLFDRNPDKDSSAAGKMVTTEKATIISCQGLYYFVQVDDGSKGFLRDTDLVKPVQLVSTNPELLPNGETPGPDPDADANPLQEVPLDANQTLMTNSAGRTVMVVNKQSEGNSEFEARRKALQEGKEMPAAADKPAAPATTAADAALPEPASVALPEPASGN